MTAPTPSRFPSRQNRRGSARAVEGTAPQPRRPAGGSFSARAQDLAFHALTGLVAVSVLVLAISLAAVLANGAKESFFAFGPSFLWGRIWDPNPNVNVFGVLPFILGTLITSAIALVLAIPIAVGSAIFLTTQAPRWFRGPVGTAIELLAAIPSVIFGIWGLYVVHPYMAKTIEPGLQRYAGWTGLFSGAPVGLDLLTAGVILSMMVVPTISAISREALAAVPIAQREAALSLGATDWETTRYAALPFARAGIVGGVILGLGRAIGETMAVIMVIGGTDRMPTSLLSGGQSIASLIANELLSYQTSLQVSAILEAGLVLLLIALGVNAAARLLVWRIGGLSEVSRG